MNNNVLYTISESELISLLECKDGYLNLIDETSIDAVTAESAVKSICERNQINVQYEGMSVILEKNAE